MNDYYMMLGILDPLYALFGWLVRVLYGFFGNYGLAIIALTIIIRGVLIPLNVSSQKSMLKMQALSGKQAELQRKYGDDKEKYQEALMELQKENGAGGLSGCLLPIIQIFLIWPIYRIVSGPLVYLSQISKDSVQQMIDRASASDLVTKTTTLVNHIGLIQALNNNADFLKTCVDKGLISMSQMIDLHFLGLDLTLVPWNVIKENLLQPQKYILLLIFPLIVLGINILQMQLTKILKPGYKEEKIAKERAKENPAKAGQVPENQAESTMKMMNWMMPLVMLYTTFILPLAMGLYWIVGGIMAIITQLITYYLFTKPYEQKKAEVELRKEQVFKKKALAAADAGSSNKSGKNKKK